MDKKTLVMAMIASCVVSQAVMAEEEEYPYMDTPVAFQISDLIDDDADGVINARDLCADTPPGALIDNDGCGEKILMEESRQLHILFANNSSVIEPSFNAQIANMAQFLKKYPGASIEVRGYASKVGSASHNQALSQQRAEAVRSRLIGYQVEPQRVAVVGYGDTRPEVNQDTSQAHAANRRVTATVVGLDEEVIKEWTIFSTRSL